MIKEIVDIGRVSNRLASVFTFKGLPEYYVEVLLEWDGKEFKYKQESIKHLSEDSEYLELGNEVYLKYGVHRGKKSSTIYIFPASFIYEEQEKVEEQILNFLTTETKYNQIYNTLKKLNYAILENNKKTKKIELKTPKESKDNKIRENIYGLIKEKIINSEITYYPRITKYYKSILKNIESINNKIEETKLQIKADLKGKTNSATINNLVKNIPVVIRVENFRKSTYFYENRLLFKVFENIEFKNSGKFINSKKKAYCNIYPDKEAFVYPSGGFYYPFSTDKVNVKYNLKDDKNLFLLSKEAYIDFLKGRTFLEVYNHFSFMGLNSFVTATSLDDDSLKEFQQDTKESKLDINSLIDLVDKNLQNRKNILLNFYFWETNKASKGKDVIEYVKDIVPSNLVQNIKLFKTLKEVFYEVKFNRKLQFSWQQYIYNLYYKDIHKKYRTSLFRKIALNDNIDLEQLLQVINKNMEYGINKKEDDKHRYYYGDVIKHLIFLDWIDKINKGEAKMSKEDKKKELFIGNSYEERLSYFLENANLVRDSNSMKLGVCVGLAINILSWTLSNYDKKILAFVSKKIERGNLNSVEAFVNNIFAKTKFQEYESLQKVNIKLSSMQMLNLDNESFNKDEFIFGLFLGSELYQNVKSQKDPEPENQNEGDEDEQ